MALLELLEISANGSELCGMALLELLEVEEDFLYRGG